MPSQALLEAHPGLRRCYLELHLPVSVRLVLLSLIPEELANAVPPPGGSDDDVIAAIAAMVPPDSNQDEKASDSSASGQRTPRVTREKRISVEFKKDEDFELQSVGQAKAQAYVMLLHHHRVPELSGNQPHLAVEASSFFINALADDMKLSLLELDAKLLHSDMLDMPKKNYRRVWLPFDGYIDLVLEYVRLREQDGESIGGKDLRDRLSKVLKQALERPRGEVLIHWVTETEQTSMGNLKASKKYVMKYHPLALDLALSVVKAMIPHAHINIKSLKATQICYFNEFRLDLKRLEDRVFAVEGRVSSLERRVYSLELLARYLVAERLRPRPAINAPEERVAVPLHLEDIAKNIIALPNAPEERIEEIIAPPNAPEERIEEIVEKPNSPEHVAETTNTSEQVEEHNKSEQVAEQPNKPEEEDCALEEALNVFEDIEKEEGTVEEAEKMFEEFFKIPQARADHQQRLADQEKIDRERKHLEELAAAESGPMTSQPLGHLIGGQLPVGLAALPVPAEAPHHQPQNIQNAQGQAPHGQQQAQEGQQQQPTQKQCNDRIEIIALDQRDVVKNWLCGSQEHFKIGTIFQIT